MLVPGLPFVIKQSFWLLPLGLFTKKILILPFNAVQEYAVQEVVVGYPKNMNGTIGERAEKCQTFADKLANLVDVPVKMWDERSTTVSAHNYLNQTNTRGKKRKEVVDAVAATIILESYLNYRKNNKDE